jgi:NAD(P) transhydrogenase subunit beta
MELICQLGYLIGAICFILGLRGLSNPKTARKGNLIAAWGMGIAIVISMIYPIEGATNNYIWIFGALIIGGIIGWISSARVQMTGMPQLVSIFNGLGGGSAMFLAILEFFKFDEGAGPIGLIVILFTLFVGAVSFSGSILAYLKLDGKIKDKHVELPKHQLINTLLLIICVTFLVYLVFNPSATGVLIAMGLFLIYGFSFVAPIGGADMPVVISLLNSVTGISAATAGFLYDNQIMILGGILVGASGTILTVLMCEAMNRSLFNVLMGGFTATATASTAGGKEQGVIQSAQAVDVAILLNYSSKVILVPGYGMAVSRAQKQAKELEEVLGEKGIEVKFGIHPVAGRMPGHMNVLLAEVDIDYDKLLDLDACNKELDDTDVVLVVGANDVVNPAAIDDPSSSIHGMPVLEVWNAKQVIVFKRTMNAGYAGIQNPLFFKPNTKMLFGDAGASLSGILDELKSLG